MAYWVKYTVPVLALVDGDEVFEVIVDDESMSPPEAVLDEDFNEVTDPPADVIRVAESTLWPSWSFGF
jgi:hypothetical protein